ncbi:hypothetical protein [Kitasatospora atroaurantiaca]|uniref:hypothetical protein n=1 Tax=Kitasatospora atroaurantiaca TaxID=285545 RepID=UPI0031D2D346
MGVALGEVSAEAEGLAAGPPEVPPCDPDGCAAGLPLGEPADPPGPAPVRPPVAGGVVPGLAAPGAAEAAPTEA